MGLKEYWTGFLFLLSSWSLALINEGLNTINLFLTALFFSVYFLMPLFNVYIKRIGFLLLISILSITFYSTSLNLFTWFIYIVLAFNFAELFMPIILYSSIIGGFSLSILPSMIHLNLLSLLFIVEMISLTVVLLIQLRKSYADRSELQKQYIKIQNEHRLMKRQLMSKEEAIRQEERNQIAREIHDSVGHRLTALLMQMEVARLKAKDSETEQQFEGFKKLAQNSLEDTRKAVKTLKTEEQSGLQAVILLIRKLESESHLRLAIKFQPGVLSMIMTNQQSIVLYRSIQEALTNMMKHSDSRSAEIEFEIIAQRDLRFKVSHIIVDKVYIKEGFGLTSMRERLLSIDGRLSFSQSEDQLSLIGQFPLEGSQYD